MRARPGLWEPWRATARATRPAAGQANELVRAVVVRSLPQRGYWALKQSESADLGHRRRQLGVIATLCVMSVSAPRDPVCQLGRRHRYRFRRPSESASIGDGGATRAYIIVDLDIPRLVAGSAVNFKSASGLAKRIWYRQDR